MARGRRSRRSTDYDYGYAPSRAATPSYRPSSDSYSTDPYSYSSNPYSYSSTSYSRTTDPYSSSYPSNRCSSHPRPSSYNTYEYVPVSPPRRSRTPFRDSTYDTTYPSSSYTYTPRRRSPSRSRTTYTYRSPTPPPRTYTPEPRPSYYSSFSTRPRSPARAWSPVNTRPTTPRRRSPSRRRHRSRSRFSRFTDTFTSALDSVPREDVRELGTAFGGFVADRLGWSNVDGRTTDQRQGRDRWRWGEDYWGYSTMA